MFTIISILLFVNKVFFDKVYEIKSILAISTKLHLYILTHGIVRASSLMKMRFFLNCNQSIYSSVEPHCRSPPSNFDFS